MQSLEDVDARLDDLNAQIGRLTDLDALKAQLSPMNESINVRQLGQLQARDVEITDEIAQLQKLWLLTTLKKEIEVNLELLEFETVFASLEKLNEKINGMTLNSQSVKSKWVERATLLNSLSIDKFIEAWKQIVAVEEGKDGCCSIEFNESVDVDDFPVMYDSFDEIIQLYSLPQNVLNLSHTIDSCFVENLFTEGHKLEIEGNRLSCIKHIPTQRSELIKSYATSTEALVDFVNLIPSPTRIINYISPRLYEKLRELITDHADIIYNDPVLKETFISLGDHLQEKNFRRNNLKEWITSDLHGFTIEHYLNEHIEQLREVFERPDFTLVTRTVTQKEQTAQHTPTLAQNINHEKLKSKLSILENNKEDDDDWGAWGDDDEEQVEEAEGVEAEEEEGDDGWGAWGDDDEEEEAKPQPKKLVSKLSHKSKSPTPVIPPQPQKQTGQSTSYQSTNIPLNVLKIIESYISTSHSLPHEHHAQHLSKVDYLATTYFMLGSVSYGSRLLQYNDVAYLHSLHPLHSLKELNDRLLLDFIKGYESEIQEVYRGLNGLDPSISAGETMHLVERIQKLLNEMFAELSVLDKGTLTKIVVSVVGEFYQLVFNSVMSKSDIGEQESEYLSQLIGKFLQLKQPLGDDIKVYVKNWEKLEKTSFILNAHLKEIMERFYKADFYEFETGELIALVDKLFANSDLKRSYIMEIREIREMTEE